VKSNLKYQAVPHLYGFLSGAQPLIIRNLDTLQLDHIISLFGYHIIAHFGQVAQQNGACRTTAGNAGDHPAEDCVLGAKFGVKNQ
jgi:hypothetical protein